MAGSRIQIASNKKAALVKQSMREVAVLLAEDPPREEKAKIKAEGLIRNDNMIEAYEILQLECEMLYERIKLIDSTKGCPKDLMSVVATLMWASQRVDIPELVLIRKQFRAKYGKGFEEAALENVGDVLNERVVSKLSYDPPAAYLVQTYLERICEKFEVDWAPTIRLAAEDIIRPMAAPGGYSVGAGQGTGLGAVNMPDATTGQANTDEEINYQKGQTSGLNIPSIPPALPVATATVYVPSNPGVGPSGNLPRADFEEVDIFVPGGSPTPPPPPAAAPGKKDPNEDDGNDDDDDNNNDDQATGGGGGGSAGVNDSSTTYDDLAARFDSLKK